MNNDDPILSGKVQDAAVPANCFLLPSLSPAMRELEGAIGDIGRADLPILILGEKGTGKEMVAREIHRHRRCGDAPFFKMDCKNQIPQFLKDFFAEISRVRRNEPDKPATVFLAEIGDLSLSCQSTLVELISDGDGKAQVERLSVRLISSTSRSLEDDIEKRRFREDLFYRVNGICLRVPPLRHRKQDIPALAEYFLKKHAEALGRPATALHPRTLQHLLQHSWPGNVRELEEMARRIVSTDERTALASLGGAAKAPAVPEFTSVLSLKEAARNASRQVERELILKTLARTRWNRKRAARELGISYKALLYKLKQIAFDDPAGI